MNLRTNLYTKSWDLAIHQSQNTHFRGYKELFGIIIFYCNTCTVCQGMRYIRSMSYALLAITELPNNELTGIHTPNLPPLLL